MGMSNQAIWQDAVLRQKDRVFRDLPARQAGIASTCILFGFFLPGQSVLWVFAACLLAEVAQIWLFRLFTRHPSRAVHLGILGNAFLGVSAFCALPFWAWHTDTTTAHTIAILALIGALLNAATVRTIDIMHGIAAAVPSAFVLLWLVLQDYSRNGNLAATAIATISVLVLLAYFLYAMIQGHHAEKVLAEARRSAEEASRAKTRFLSAMSHEMRTPLNTILGLSQLLRAEPSVEAARGHASDVEDAARRLHMLINDALDLAATAEGELKYRPVTSSLRRELEEALALSAAQRRNPDARATVEIEAGVPELARIDPNLLRKCLGGLSVAVAGASLAPQMHLDCRPVQGLRNRLVLRLTATTPGPVPAASPFVDTVGLDLALAFVERIARTMGGRVRFTAEPGTPAAAEIELPYGPVAEPSEGAGTGRHALVVDDISTNRFVIVQLLRSLGMNATEADSGAAALAFLSEKSVDVVLLDMNMPGMDGVETFRRIRATAGSGAVVPVIALTADFLSEQRDRLMDMGLDGYVPKPIDRRVLWAEIEAAVTRPQVDQFGLSIRTRT
jgi:CheY-like chemotaxis protein/signal transduction histidine kinase